MPNPEDELQTIPRVGKSISASLRSLGINKVGDLRGKNAEAMYEQMLSQPDFRPDRCLLYVFRCAVYYAEHDKPDPEKLKWWNWKD